MSETLKGVVKWFNDAKGFGFIEHTSGKDVFVHYSVIEADGFKTLKDGEEVEYEIKEGPKGLHALRVQRVVKTQIIELQDGELPGDDSEASDSSSEDSGSDDSDENTEKRLDA